MSGEPVVRSAFPSWPAFNARLRDLVAGLSDADLAIRPEPGRWPLWATIGHLACQRVFWLCDVAGEPGADTTRFTDASSDCPGDDDLETVLDAAALARSLDDTYRIVEGCLVRWTPASLETLVRHPAWPRSEHHTRGFVLERVFAHDVSHIAEINETLGRAGLPQVDLWS